MFQLYPIFERDNVEEAYRKLNAFLAELEALDVHVPLENVRTNTKFYPDYGQTATTIEVAVEMSGVAAYQLAPKIMEAHRLVLSSTVEVPEPDTSVEEAYRIIAKSQFAPGCGVLLDSDAQGWMLTDLQDMGHIFYGVHRNDVLWRVKESLASLGVQPVPDKDFDPFLDSDETLS